MTGLRTTPGSADPDETGPNYTDKVKTEVEELWGRVPHLLDTVAGTNTITASCVGTTPTAYFDGMTFVGELVNAPTGAATMNINSIGAKALVTDDGTAMTSGVLSADTLYIFKYLSGDDHIRVTGTSQLVKILDHQTFTSNGTWTKPTGATGDEIVIVECWGAGGGGSASGNNGGGGGGGGYSKQTFKASDLGATETVTIGAGGAAGAPGTVGGDTTFGAHLTGYGGGAGYHTASTYAGGGGGGATAAGGSATTSVSGAGGGPFGGAALSAEGDGFDGVGGGSGGFYGAGGAMDGGDGWFGGGGGGGGVNALSGDGGDSVWGGGGGGGGLTASNGGASLHGGNGGGTSVAGTAPGGGGGYNAAGARGECRVIMIG